MSDKVKEAFQKFSDFLDSEEGQRSLKEFIEEKEKERQETKAFFESSEFFDILDRIRNWMIQSGASRIDSDDFSYGHYYDKHLGSIELPIIDSDFYKVTESILESLESETDESNYFSNEYIIYNEWRVEVISGQGTITTLSLDKSKMRDKIIDKIIEI